LKLSRNRASVLSFTLGVFPEQWGVINTFGNVHKGLSAGNGSVNTVSKAAPEEYVQGLLNIVQTFQKCYPQPLNAVQIAMENLDLEFVSNDLPQLLNSMRVGSERIRDIVRSLRNFSRLDEAEIKPVNIHEGIKNTYPVTLSTYSSFYLRIGRGCGII
jgi:signal transduction histidine kinase